jgi:hypothetical protein
MPQQIHKYQYKEHLVYENPNIKIIIKYIICGFYGSYQQGTSEYTSCISTNVQENIYIGGGICHKHNIASSLYKEEVKGAYIYHLNYYNILHYSHPPHE